MKKFSILCMGRCKPLGSLNSFVRAGAASVGSQFWEASFTFRDQKLLIAVTFLAYRYGRRYFHFIIFD